MFNLNVLHTHHPRKDNLQEKESQNSKRLTCYRLKGRQNDTGGLQHELTLAW